MVKLQEHIDKIKETQKQIERTKSPYRKRDLQRRLNVLLEEYRECRMNLKDAGRLP